MNEVRVRLPTSTEWPIWRDLRLRALADSPDAFGATLESSAGRTDAEWMEAASTSHSGAHPLLGFVGDEPAGMGFVRVIDVSAHLYAMWVDPRHRRKGVAEALVRHAIGIARAEGAKTVDLRVTSSNNAAEKLYLSCGFEDTGGMTPLRPGSALQTRSMILRIEDSAGTAPFSLRRASVSDAAGIAAVRIASWRAGYRDLMPPAFLDALNQEEDAARFARWLGSPEVDGFVAERDNRIVGFTLLRPSRDDDCARDTGEIPTFYVLPDCWRQGVGKALCRATLDRARERRMPNVSLWVIEDNHRARAFYEAAGFKADGGVKTDLELVGAPLRELRYGLHPGDHAEQTDGNE